MTSDTTERPDAIRIFLAVPVPPEIVRKLTDLQDRLRPILPGTSWSRPEQQHLTLRFYGNVPEDEIAQLTSTITDICGQMPPLRLCADKVGTFADQIIWVGVSGGVEELLALQKRISNATCEVGACQDDRGFHPHLTIGRIKKRLPGREGAAARIQDWSNTSFGDWTADHLELMRSDLSPQGACHTCLARIPLTGKVGVD